MRKTKRHTHCMVAGNKKRKKRKTPRKADEYETLVSGGHFEFDIKKEGDSDIGSHMCCDCLLVHHWHIEMLPKGKLRINVFRDDYTTEKVRSGKK